jgi:hypothetical protein
MPAEPNAADASTAEGASESTAEDTTDPSAMEETAK